jgi:hypothetical protein
LLLVLDLPHPLLGHLLEGLLLLLYQLHPLLRGLLEGLLGGLLALLRLLGDREGWGVEKLHVGVYGLLHYLLLPLDLISHRLHRSDPSLRKL